MHAANAKTDSDAPAAHWTDGITDCAACANCGELRDGKFCSNCGQRHLIQRIRLGDLIRDLLRRLSAVEAGLFHTWWNLCRRPGQVARDYVSGKQRPYVNPLTYFFLSATLQLLAFWNVSSLLRGQLRDQFAAQLTLSSDQAALQKAEQVLGQSVADALVDSYVTAIMQGYSYAALLFFVVPFGFMLWLLHGGLGERFRIGETVIFSLFIFSQMLFYTAISTPITSRVHSSAQLAMAILVYLVVPQIAHSQFFRRTWLSRLMTLLATIMAWVPFVTSIVGLFLFSFLIKLLLAVRLASE